MKGKGKVNQRGSNGICNLTHLQGKFAKCHLVPQAFTKPEISGRPLIQVASGESVTRRWSSWYDKKLVTSSGEKLLGEIDNWGIKFLRSKRLVWSGWPNITDKPVLDGDKKYHSKNIRTIAVDNPARLRRFFLSLFWRAAATNLPDFSEIEVSKEDLETVRKILLEEIPDQSDLFACNLFQLTTTGPIHNMTPIRKKFDLQDITDGGPSDVFRFYFDGLVAWVNANRNPMASNRTKYLWALATV